MLPDLICNHALLHWYAQVVRKHLNGLRRVLIAERETHAAAMKHYNKKLELEKLKQQLLKEAGEGQECCMAPGSYVAEWWQ